MTLIRCHTAYGKTRLIPKDRLTQRSSVYGVIVHDGHVLLVSMRTNDKYILPGGGIDVGELIEDALRREVREETGIEIEIDRFAHFKEDFYYYDPTGEVFHGFLFFYTCRPRTFELAGEDQILDDEAERPEWVAIETLRPDALHAHGAEVMEILGLWR